MYIKRKIEGTIFDFLEKPEIIAVLGPRQAGKTTLLKHIAAQLPKEKTKFITFEDKSALNMFEKETDDFIQTYIKGQAYLFIDEFQYAKHGGKILKYIFDTQKIKLITSGSSSPDLTVKAIKYLVGRVLVFELYPFDFEEFLLARGQDYLSQYQDIRRQFYEHQAIDIPGNTMHKKMLELYEEYLLYGGYPQVVLADKRPHKIEFLRNIYNTYFLREVRDILGLIDDYKLSSLVKGLALQAGSLIEYTELARLSGFSYVSLKKYMNFLAKTYICYFARPFFRNKRTEVVKNPKVYFMDSGLRNAVVNDFRKLSDRPDKGGLLENGLAQQFLKSGYTFNFWRDKKKHEVDFIVPLGEGRVMAVESKSYYKGGRLAGLELFSKKYPEVEAYISYQELAKQAKETKNAVPVYIF